MRMAGLYLHVKDAGKYWRMSYRYIGRQKTLAFGVYPAVSLAKARRRRDKARELLADGIDPGVAKRQEKQAKADAAANTFEAVSARLADENRSQTRRGHADQNHQVAGTGHLPVHRQLAHVDHRPARRAGPGGS